MSRVVVVGGAGVFGRRLVAGLRATTDAEVIVAGRTLSRAETAMREAGAHGARAFDRNTVSPTDLRALEAAVIVDAAGPFQGGDLGFARACIEAGVTYLDLADARDFVAAFPQLDVMARANGVAAVTGASSTPALTHAVLDHICAGWRRIDGVRVGIAPAAKMERGAAVMKAILSWTGARVRVFEGGCWRERSAWSDCGVLDVPGLGQRRFALADVPDLDLIPARYAPRDTALFMAGLELPVMQRGMEAIGALRRWRILRDPASWASLLRRGGEFLAPFGSDRGGMIVEATGRDTNDQPVCVRWSMVAADGKGPLTPTFAALILVRRMLAGERFAIGARPCVGMVRLREFAVEFARHGFTTQIDVTPVKSPFEKALGAEFEAAPPRVRAAHRAGPVTRLRGEACVHGAASPLGRLIARLFGMPAAAAEIPVRVTMRTAPDGEVWTRRFGARLMESRLRFVRPGVVRESFGPFGFDMRIWVGGDALAMTIIGWRVGPIPLPSVMAPRSTARETEGGDRRFRFDVPITAPLIGLLSHYSGWLEPEQVEADAAPAQREVQ